MKAQVEAAAQFLIQLISQNQPRNIADDRLQQFKMNLINLLEQSFQGHWYPGNPERGQAYRCIRLNSGSCADPIINRAALEVGLEYAELKLPVELTLWVDPHEVSCRFGENEGSFCTVASFHNDDDVQKDSQRVNSSMTPLEVATNHDRSIAVNSNPSSPRMMNHTLSPSSSPVPVQYRVSCFYSSYENSQKGWYLPTQTSQYSPPVAVNYHVSPSKSTSRYGLNWGLAYVPQIRYLNNWAMGQMVKV